MSRVEVKQQLGEQELCREQENSHLGWLAHTQVLRKHEFCE